MHPTPRHVRNLSKNGGRGAGNANRWADLLNEKVGNVKVFLIGFILAMLSGVIGAVVLQQYIAAQQSAQLTAFGVCVLSFCAGYIVSWLVWVARIGGN